MTVRWMALLLIVVLGGCAETGHYRQTSQQTGKAMPQMEPIIVRVSGFGTYENVAKDRLNTRKRLMARRASQLDAYRNLAERVYGTVIYGSSTVNDFVLNNDIFRAYVDSYIRGAKLVAVNEHSDGVVESVMELKLEPRFRQCVAEAADDEAVRDMCPIPMPRGNDRVGDVDSGKVDSLYYIE